MMSSTFSGAQCTNKPPDPPSGGSVVFHSLGYIFNDECPYDDDATWQTITTLQKCSNKDMRIRHVDTTPLPGDITLYHYKVKAETSLPMVRISLRLTQTPDDVTVTSTVCAFWLCQVNSL